MIETREIINVEDYPHVNVDTEDGREELSAIAYRLASGRTPIHFVFHQNGKEIGEMFIRSMFGDRLQ